MCLWGVGKEDVGDLWQVWFVLLSGVLGVLGLSISGFISQWVIYIFSSISLCLTISGIHISREGVAHEGGAGGPLSRGDRRAGRLGGCKESRGGRDRVGGWGQQLS